MSTAQHQDTSKKVAPPSTNGATATPKKVRKARAVGAKALLVVYGEKGAQTVITFADKVVPNEKGENVILSAKKQATDFINSPEAPQGAPKFYYGAELKTKQRL